MARVWRRCARSLGALLALGVWRSRRRSLACTSPTLPLPPPAAPSISTGTEPDTFKLTSIDGAEPNALIVIVNRNEALPRDKRVTGTIADERGSWDATVIAKLGDVLDISQESGSTRSPGTTVTVHADVARTVRASASSAPRTLRLTRRFCERAAAARTSGASSMTSPTRS